MSTDVMPDRAKDNRGAPGAADHDFDARYLSGEQAEELRAPWRDRAACKGQGALMDDPAREWEAKDLCFACPVIEACTNWVSPLGGARDPGGVVAARTEQQRTRERKSRAAIARHTARTGETAAEVTL